MNNQLIAAISTPPGLGGIAIIRITGTGAKKCLDSCFTTFKKDAKLTHSHLVYGKISDNLELIDEVMAVVFNAPNSYTGEEMVEINSHGGSFIAEKILNILFKNGAEPAGPGEFTKRAFLNGKMDLIKAESVADLIHADSEKSHLIATRQLKGELSKTFNIIAESIKELLMFVEVDLDFAEDDISVLDNETNKIKFESLLKEIKGLITGFSRAKLISNGFKLALIGVPNSGKSSLFNRLCGMERVIVSEHAGTTRDTVEASISINGIKVTLIDTAGIRDNADEIEKVGIGFSFKAAEEADLILYLSEFNDTLFESFELSKIVLDKTLKVITKSDLLSTAKISELIKKDPSLLFISAKNGHGIETLEENILTKITGVKGEGNLELLTSARQKNSLVEANKFISNAYNGFKAGSDQVLIASDLRSAIDKIGEITGKVTNEDILNKIFSSFCIGK